LGGGSIGEGMQPLYDDPSIELMAFDIYASPHVQFISDAHCIPLADHSFDGVIVQAVLEHVLEPVQVVAEIYRVLNRQGVVYSETPFLQHVHEGAYDFTRFSESGHRYLFKHFELFKSGVVGSAGTQLLWSIDYFVKSLFRSRVLGKGFRVLFFWLQYLDVLIPEPYGVDAASGVFFLGIKSDRQITPSEIIKHYKGAQFKKFDGAL
jgi:SAM-dependent methyltransferase